jgi:hypothetical protein
MMDSLKAIWPLLQSITGGLVLALVLGFTVWAAMNGKFVSGRIYDQTKAKCDDWEKKYLDLLTSLIPAQFRKGGEGAGGSNAA